MAIYTRKTNEKIINSTIRIDPGCYIGNKVVKLLAAVDKLRLFYLTELIADQGPEEITSVVDIIVHPAKAIQPLWEIERDAIINALTLLNEDHRATAEALGIDEATLSRKLEEYAVSEHPLFQKVRQSAKDLEPLRTTMKHNNTQF